MTSVSTSNVNNKSFTKKTIETNNIFLDKIEAKINDRVALLIFFAISVFLILPRFFLFDMYCDGAFHYERLLALSKEISFDNLKPLMYSNTYFQSGYPLGLFYPDIFMYPFAVLAKFGIGYYNAILLYKVFITFTSGLSFYYCIGKVFKYQKIEMQRAIIFISTLFYILFPGRLWVFIGREGLGEAQAYIAWPIIVLGIYEIFYNKRFSFALFFGMITLFNAHFVSTIITCVFLAGYYILNIKKIIDYPKIVLYTGINAILTIVSALVTILPILEMQSNTTMYYMTGEKTFGLVKSNALSLCNNSDVVSVIATILLLIVIVIFTYKKNYKSKLLMTNVFILFTCTDLFFWGVLEALIPQVNIIQFPVRMLTFCGLPFALYLVLAHRDRIVTILMIVSIFAIWMVSLTILVRSPVDNMELNDNHSIGQGEYLPNDVKDRIMEYVDGKRVWDNELMLSYYDKYNIKRNGNKFTFDAIDGKVVFPINCYVGYEVSDGNRTYPYKSEDGLLTVENLKCNKLTITYVGTTIQKVSSWISYLSFIAISIFALYRKKKLREEEYALNAKGAEIE